VRAESITIRRGQRYGTHVHGEQFGELGYEYDLRPNGATALWDLELWNPGGRDTSPAIVFYVGLGVAGGLVAGRMPKATRIMVEGADGIIGEAANTAQEAIFGIIEDFIGDPDLTDGTTVSARASEALTKELENTIAVAVELDDTLTAYQDFDIGDTIPVEAPGYFARHNRRVTEIALRGETRDGETFWSQTVTASKLKSGDAARNEAIYRYLIGLERLPEAKESGIITPSPSQGRAPTIVLAATSSTPESQARADYIFGSNGTTNAGYLEAAIARIGQTDGRLLWTEGTFSLGDALITIPSGCTMRWEGAGEGVTFYEVDDDTADFLTVAGSLHVDHMTIRQEPGG
jgi:hypothetical protein